MATAVIGSSVLTPWLVQRRPRWKSCSSNSGSPHSGSPTVNCGIHTFTHASPSLPPCPSSSFSPRVFGTVGDTGAGEKERGEVGCVVQSLSRVQLLVIPGTVARQASLSFIVSRSLPKHVQYSCLKSPMDRGAQWATVHVVAESWT